MSLLCLFFFFFFKQKTAYEMRISDWSSDVCSSDLHIESFRLSRAGAVAGPVRNRPLSHSRAQTAGECRACPPCRPPTASRRAASFRLPVRRPRSEEHTSELQSLMRISYAVFCLKNKNKLPNTYDTTRTECVHNIQ